MMLKNARTWLINPENGSQLKDTPACTVRAGRPLHLLKLKGELLFLGMTGGIVSLIIFRNIDSEGERATETEPLSVPTC